MLHFLCITKGIHFPYPLTLSLFGIWVCALDARHMEYLTLWNIFSRVSSIRDFMYRVDAAVQSQYLWRSKTCLVAFSLLMSVAYFSDTQCKRRSCNDHICMRSPNILSRFSSDHKCVCFLKAMTVRKGQYSLTNPKGPHKFMQKQGGGREEKPNTFQGVCIVYVGGDACSYLHTQITTLCTAR